MPVEFGILGPLEARRDGKPLPLGGARQRALLALLLTRANTVVSAEWLSEELWGAEPPRGIENALQYHVSQLRKALAPDTPIVTRDRGYGIRVAADELDLFRFERLVTEAQRSPPAAAAQLLRDALGLWRGPALSDLGDAPAARAETLRLEELRLNALEQRIDAELAVGRHAEVVAELEALAHEHPLRERLRGQLMRALYASGRQADALEVYRKTRSLLADELGIEPSPALRDLESAILRHDAAVLGCGSAAPGALPTRAVMAIARHERDLDGLLTIAEALARNPRRELIVVRLLDDESTVSAASAGLAERRRALAERDVSVRVAAYTAPQRGAEAMQLAIEHDVDLVLVDATPRLLEDGSIDDELGVLLAGAPCDVGILAHGPADRVGPVVAPFGGVEHEWSAIEIAAWLAGSFGTTLRLVGTEADLASGRRDASRLLARASLVVQQVVGIDTEPVLVPRGEEGMLAATHDARLLVIGLPERWRSEGIGRTRLRVATRAGLPTLFVRRGLRPSGVAPRDTYTRFTWTLGAEVAEGAEAPGRAT